MRILEISGKLRDDFVICVAAFNDWVIHSWVPSHISSLDVPSIVADPRLIFPCYIVLDTHKAPRGRVWMVHRDDIVVAQLLSTYQPSVGADCDWHVPELTWRVCKQDNDIIMLLL